jgi:hypothetical protein
MPDGDDAADDVVVATGTSGVAMIGLTREFMMKNSSPSPWMYSKNQE